MSLTPAYFEFGDWTAARANFTQSTLVRISNLVMQKHASISQSFERHFAMKLTPEPQEPDQISESQALAVGIVTFHLGPQWVVYPTLKKFFFELVGPTYFYRFELYVLLMYINCVDRSILFDFNHNKRTIKTEELLQVASFAAGDVSDKDIIKRYKNARCSLEPSAPSRFLFSSTTICISGFTSEGSDKIEAWEKMLDQHSSNYYFYDWVLAF
jgi:hypothetical protein